METESFGDSAEEAAYVAMTRRLIEAFPRTWRRVSNRGRRFQRQLFLRGQLAVARPD